MKALVLAALLAAGCGAVRPTLHVRDAFWADAYGFACRCGAKTFQIIGRTPSYFHLRCPDCHEERVVYSK